ncbi:hypothetical protein ES703_64137 [subsurface metagenome]
MKTDIDTCLKDIRGWFAENQRAMMDSDLEAILLKRCESETEVEVTKFIIWASFHKLRERLDEIKRLEGG